MTDSSPQAPGSPDDNGHDRPESMQPRPYPLPTAVDVSQCLKIIRITMFMLLF